MFDIDLTTAGQWLSVAGWMRHRPQRPRSFLDRVLDECILDMAALDYISSAGLGVLLKPTSA